MSVPLSLFLCFLAQLFASHQTLESISRKTKRSMIGELCTASEFLANNHHTSSRSTQRKQNTKKKRKISHARLAKWDMAGEEEKELDCSLVGKCNINGRACLSPFSRLILSIWAHRALLLLLQSLSLSLLYTDTCVVYIHLWIGGTNGDSTRLIGCWLNLMQTEAARLGRFVFLGLRRRRRRRREWMKIFIGSLSSFSSSFTVLPIAFEQRDNSMSLVLVRDAAAKFFLFLLKENGWKKRDGIYPADARRLPFARHSEWMRCCLILSSFSHSLPIRVNDMWAPSLTHTTKNQRASRTFE